MLYIRLYTNDLTKVTIFSQLFSLPQYEKHIALRITVPEIESRVPPMAMDSEVEFYFKTQQVQCKNDQSIRKRIR